MKKLIAILLTMRITFFVLSGCNTTKSTDDRNDGY